MSFELTQKALSAIMTTARSTTGTVIGASGNIVSVAIDQPRIDYSDGQAALLVEAASTNLVPNSAASVADWANQGATVTSLSINALGVFPGVEVVTISGTGDRLQSQNSGWTSGTSYTVSCWYKAGVGGQCRITVRDVDAGQQSTVTGAAGALAFGTSLAGTITNIVNTDLGGGVCKVTFLFVPNSTTATNGRIGIGAGTSTPGDSVIALGAQLEAGTVTTSYIPTTGAAVTRASDFYTVNVSALGVSSAFTLAMKGVYQGPTGSFDRLYQMDNGSNTERINGYYHTSSGTIRSQQFVADTPLATAVGVAYTPGTSFAIAVRADATKSRMCANGTLSAEVTNTAPYTPPTILRLGHASGTPSMPPRMRIKSFLLYPALATDASLTAMGTV